MRKIRTTTEINEKWNPYDQVVAEMHLLNYGKIFLDEFDCPIDDEFELEAIAF